MSIFKKKKINFSNTTEKELTKYIKKMDVKNQKEYDYTDQYWGHAITFQDLINKTPRIFHILAFNSSRIQIGDIILQNLESNKIGKYLVLKIKYFNDPQDMFKADIVGIGYN